MKSPPLQQPATARSLPLPFHLTIRFSNALPDLELDIPSPQTTTVLSLKHLIRTRLSTRNRLRFIYHGHLLPDPSALSAVIKPPPSPPPPPPPPSSSPPDHVKGKGKAVDGGAQPVRIYVNCSIGDELSAQDLADEQAAADQPPDDSSSAAQGQGHAPSSWARPRPRGFDRLLQAGFTSSEIATLRTQFASIRTEGFASDAMPSPDTLRNMEDAWIDNNAAGELPSAANPLEDDFSAMSSVLDVMIRAMMVGFFFPLASLTWLLRSDVWSEKWRIFVGSGVILSLVVGIVTGMSGTNS